MLKHHSQQHPTLQDGSKSEALLFYQYSKQKQREILGNNHKNHPQNTRIHACNILNTIHIVDGAKF